MHLPELLDLQLVLQRDLLLVQLRRHVTLQAMKLHGVGHLHHELAG